MKFTYIFITNNSMEIKGTITAIISNGVIAELPLNSKKIYSPKHTKANMLLNDSKLLKMLISPFFLNFFTNEVIKCT